MEIAALLTLQGETSVKTAEVLDPLMYSEPRNNRGVLVTGAAQGVITSTSLTVRYAVNVVRTNLKRRAEHL